MFTQCVSACQEEKRGLSAPKHVTKENCRSKTLHPPTKLLKARLKSFRRDVSERDNSSRSRWWRRTLRAWSGSRIPLDLTTSTLSSGVYPINTWNIKMLEFSVSLCLSVLFYPPQEIRVSKVRDVKWSGPERRPRAAPRLQADFKGKVYRN